MKHRSKKLFYIGFIILTLAVVIVVGASNGDFSASMRAMLAIPPGYMLLGAACVFGGILMQCLSLDSALIALGHRLRLTILYAISVLGEFYSYITPGASGGQPMQVYQFHRCGVSVGDATAALTIHFHCFQLTLLTADVVLFIAYREFITAQLGANLPFLIIGFFANLLIVSLSLMIAFYQRPIRWLLKVSSKLTRRFKIGKPDALESMLGSLADGYFTAMRRLVSSRAEMARQFTFALGRLVLLMSVMYCIYRGLGQTAASYGKLFAMSCVQYTSAAYTPLPGASGAQEGLFSLYYEGLLPGELLLSGLLAWRFITYYLVLIVGAIVTAALGMTSKTPDEVQSEIQREP